jgi:hypothetical protein
MSFPEITVGVTGTTAGGTGTCPHDLAATSVIAKMHITIRRRNTDFIDSS